MGRPRCPVRCLPAARTPPTPPLRHVAHAGPSQRSPATSSVAPSPAASSPAGQAESSERPLRRRAATIARPARVRIRSRKPCVLALRRLFGWKVRLLTRSSPPDTLQEGQRAGAPWPGQVLVSTVRRGRWPGQTGTPTAHPVGGIIRRVTAASPVYGDFAERLEVQRAALLAFAITPVLPPAPALTRLDHGGSPCRRGVAPLTLRRLLGNPCRRRRPS